jgi:Ni/Co efflux regulator RcnB
VEKRKSRGKKEKSWKKGKVVEKRKSRGKKEKSWKKGKVVEEKSRHRKINVKSCKKKEV